MIKEIYGHDIDVLLEMRNEMLLNEVFVNDMIYMIVSESLAYCILKEKVTLKDIDNYTNIGKLYGLTVYVSAKCLEDMSTLLFKE